MEPPRSQGHARTGRAARTPRLGIPTRIFLAFATVVVSFGIVSAVSLAQHRRSAATLGLLQQGYIPLALSLAQLRATWDNFASQLERVADDADPSTSVGYVAGVRETRPDRLHRALAHIRRAEALQHDPDDQSTLSEIHDELTGVERRLTASEPDLDALFVAVEEGRRDDVRAIVDRLEPGEVEMATALRRALGSVQQRMSDASLEAANAESQAVSTIAFLGLAALFAGAFVTWWARRLLRPLPALEERVLAVARGDLSHRLGAETGRDDEIGRLAREFERMVDALATRDQRLRDVAEALRELQKMQEQIVASLRAAVVVVGDDRELRAANAAARTIFGEAQVKSGASLGRSGLLDRVPGLGDAIDAVRKTGEPRALLAVRLLPGAETTVDVLVTPFGEALDGARAERAVLVVADDVTEALRTKERLLKSERLAAMGRMAAHVTHEVRNPLSSIGLNAELLADELHGKREAEELLRAIQREVDRLTSITEEYLRVARLPAPMLVAESAGDLTLAATRFVDREMKSAGVTLETKIEPNLSPLLLDEAQIRQALLNLLRNAREAMPEGGRITVRVREDAGGVVIEVADEGTGIPPEGKERIFDLFFSTKEKGTGLGLTLTREIVVAHGGRLDVRDGVPKGTVFSIWLPRVVPAPEGRAAA